ncbi:SHOCT domain-containing protein [Actinoplanes sp. NBC_00393]|uniref:SHOCT domain-containing protein n=1 Tax=Actinoplanes sp. NBC_00393 TaxID=2975953 RepID=UPI002E246A7C
MLLVPKQLRRSGMTGSVPYYGGRFTPAQAYAASHPSGPRPRPAMAPDRDPLPALQELLDAGVITAEEYRDLRARVNR